MFELNFDHIIMKKILLSTLIGGVFNFLLGWLVYGILFASVTKQLASPEVALISLKEEEIRLGYLFLSCTMGALLMAFIFVKAGNINTWLAGAKTGAIIGLIMAAWINSSLYSMTKYFTFPGMLFDVALNTLMAAATGVVVALVISKVKD